MNGYAVQVSLDEIFGNHFENGAGMIITTGQNEFLGVGKGFRVLITERSPSPFKPVFGYGSVHAERGGGDRSCEPKL